MKLREIVEAYKASRAYKALAYSTRRNTEKALAKVAHMMDRPASKVTRGMLMALMDDMTPGSAYVFGTRMRALFSFALQRDMVETNPMIGAVLPKSGSIRPWTDQEYEAMTGPDVHAQVRMAVILAYYTGQRISDVVRMRWADVFTNMDGGNALWVRQKKTGIELFIPVHPVLQRELDGHPKLGGTIIADAFGYPYALDSFRRKFSRERDRLGLSNTLQFHGLRKMMACKLAASGATTEQIKAVGGWLTTSQVDGYTRGAEQFAMAKGAMAKLT